MSRHYLGDGVFAEFNAATLAVVLTTEDGIRTTNRIVLDPDVLDALGRFVKGEVYRRQDPAPPLEDGRELTGPEAAAAISDALDARTREAGRKIVEALEAAPEPVIDAARLELDRVDGIRNAVRAARLPTEFGERLIREGVELLEVQRMIVAELTSKAAQS